MIPLLSRQAVRAVDQDAVERLGIPSVVLMENAGRGATDVLTQRMAGRLQRPLIVAGVGQNGGDGWVVARHLRLRGLSPRCILVGKEAKVRGDARTNLDLLRALGQQVEVLEGDDLTALRSACAHASVAVDALFGTGLDRPIEGRYREAVQIMAEASAPVFALDLPSGIDADTGQVLGVAARAAVTVTFAAHKLGLHQYPGVQYAGEVWRAHIGVPEPQDVQAGLIEAEDVRRAVPVRAGDAHKGTAGHVIALAGSPGKTGAALLSALGGLRGGAGLVTVAAREGAQRALDQKVVEVMTACLSDARPVEDALELAQGKASALVGPGLGLDDQARELALAAAQQLPVPAVLDADALTALGSDLERLQQAAAPRVLTPHPGEAGRLLERGAGDVQADRYGAARELAQRSGQLAVLKGARTVVAAPDGRLGVCPRGTSALGVAGAGDVLTGVLAAALASGGPAFEAVCAGVWLHARAGELAARSDRGLLASEIADALPLALEDCRAAGA